MARIRMRPTRTLGAALLLFVLGVATGRLILEPSGQGLIIFLAVLPVMVIVLIVLFGVGPGIFFMAVFAGAALVFYAVVRFSAAGWVTLLLVPAVALSLYIMINTIRSMRTDAVMAREGKEEE